MSSYQLIAIQACYSSRWYLHSHISKAPTLRLGDLTFCVNQTCVAIHIRKLIINIAK